MVVRGRSKNAPTQKNSYNQLKQLEQQTFEQGNSTREDIGAIFATKRAELWFRQQADQAEFIQSKDQSISSLSKDFSDSSSSITDPVGIDELYTAAFEYIRTTNTKTKLRDRIVKKLNLKDLRKHSFFFSRCFVLLSEDQEKNTENHNTLSLINELATQQQTQPLSQDLYQRAKRMLQPRVQKILDCNIESWKDSYLKKNPKLHSTQSIQQLIHLSYDQMFVSDLMKFKNHDGQSLRQDLLGDWEPEYTYISTTIRPIFDFARIDAILHYEKKTGQFPTDCLREHETLQGKHTFCVNTQQRVPAIIQKAENAFQQAKEDRDAKNKQIVKKMNREIHRFEKQLTANITSDQPGDSENYRRLCDLSAQLAGHSAAFLYDKSIAKKLHRHDSSIQLCEKLDRVCQKHKNKIDQSIAQNIPTIRHLAKRQITNLPPAETHLHTTKDRLSEFLSPEKFSEINEVSEIVGYKDPLYFSKVFKKIYGLSPTNFLKSNI